MMWKIPSFRYFHAGCQRCMALFDNSPLPRISVPHRLVEKINKIKTKQAIERASKKRVPRFKSPPVIACKRKEYNHHRGQSYTGFDPKLLASHGWKHYKSVGDYFTLNSYQGNPSVEMDSSTFADFDLNADLIRGLEEMGMTSPTAVQRQTIPKLLEGNNVQCAAETGSGKTLAYLLPIMELITRQHNSSTETSRVNSPVGIILVPTWELAEQVLDVAVALSDYAPCVPHCLLGGQGTKQKLAYPMKKDIDLLICTPGILRKMLAARIIHSSRLQHLVLDEADTLLDDSFGNEIRDIIRKLKVVASSPSGDDTFVSTGVQVTIVSATQPRSLDQIIGDIIPMESLERVTTSHLHHLMPHVSQKFVRLSASQKEAEIVKLATAVQESHTPTMIFCNSSATCYWLSKVLTSNRVDSVRLTAHIKPKDRVGIFERFQDGEWDILVSTDILSRGMDTVRVEKVVNFDFPLYISDYIHRAGRVGRVGSKGSGQVISFVTHPWDVELLWNIETAARKSRELHNVNANIKRKIDSVVIKKYGPPKDVMDK